MANNIIGWDPIDFKWYLCEYLCNPAGAGASYEITNGATIDGYTFVLTGAPGDQQVSINDSDGRILRMKWYLSGSVLYRFYEWQYESDGTTTIEIGLVQRGQTYLYASNPTWQDGIYLLGYQITGSSPSYVLDPIIELYTGVDPGASNIPVITLTYS